MFEGMLASYTTLCMCWTMCYKYIVDVVDILLRRKSNVLHWMIYFDSLWSGHTDNRNAYLCHSYKKRYIEAIGTGKITLQI